MDVRRPGFEPIPAMAGADERKPGFGLGVAGVAARAVVVAIAALAIAYVVAVAAWLWSHAYATASVGLQKPQAPREQVSELADRREARAPEQFDRMALDRARRPAPSARGCAPTPPRRPRSDDVREDLRLHRGERLVAAQA
jgi:hypothetical protein